MSDLFMNMQCGHFNGPVATASAANSDFDNTAEPLAKMPTAADEAEYEHEDDTFENTLSLKLRKPKHWRWELTTSRSCSNIALPRILLYDHTGALLVDANSPEEQVYKPHEFVPPTRSPARKRSSIRRSISSNLEHSIRKALDHEFNSLQIQEATPSGESAAQSVRLTCNSPASSSTIDFYTNELPDYQLERRSSSLKSVRFNVIDVIDSQQNDMAFPVVDLPTPPSTSTTLTTTGSSSSGPREKRRYRRSHSSGRSPTVHSESILERFSFNKGRFSSPEFAEEHEVYHAPRYFLRTSKAGTLVVQEESFSRCRRRRKLKNSSSENVHNNISGKSSRSASSLRIANASPRHLEVPIRNEPQCGSLKNVAVSSRKKAFPVRRYCSDGNILARKQLSTSEEEDAASAEQLDLGLRNRGKRKYSSNGRQRKRDFVTVDPDNSVLHALESATAR